MQEPPIYQYKSYLFTIAYNMVGEVAAAEDLVQDTFEKWLQTDQEKVNQEKAYLSRILINKAIDKLEKLKKEREAYKGLWMPQPLLADEYTQQEHNLEYAVLFLLEKLNPYERAVFVLKEVFSFSHQEIASMLDVSADNCRQVLHRAKDKVRSPRKHNEADVNKQQELLEAFVQAAYQDNFEKLKEFLLEDIVMYQDGGGKIAAALKPISGREKVVKFLDVVLHLDPDVVYDIKPLWINGSKGIMLYRNSIPDTIFLIEVRHEKISELFFIRNPDKITLTQHSLTG